MTRLIDYITQRLVDLTAEIEYEENFYESNGYLRQNNVTDIRKRAHELKMLCEYGVSNKELEDLSKMVYGRIVTLDEGPLQKI